MDDLENLEIYEQHKLNMFLVDYNGDTVIWVHKNISQVIAFGSSLDLMRCLGSYIKGLRINSIYRSDDNNITIMVDL